MGDERLERVVGKLLRAGVAAAAAIVLTGGIWYLAAAGRTFASYRRFEPDVRSLHALSTLPAPQAVILAGLLVLIATPVARVALCLVAFAMERDRIYVASTVIVLLILLYSISAAWL